MCEAVRKYGDERECRGREEGLKEGLQNKQKQVIQSALQMKMPLETIAKLVELPIEGVRKLIAEMNS